MDRALPDGAAVTLGAMRVLATLQAALETETEFGGRARVWSDVTDLWVELTVKGAGEPAEGGLRPVFTEDALAVSHDDPLAEQGQILLQFLSAEQVGPQRWRLTGLLRGQLGSEPAMAAVTPAGAAVVVLTGDLARGAVALDERGLPLLWRVAPAGGPPGGAGSAQADFTWRAAALRPWSPAHLRIAAAGGDLAISWMRRARLGGDGWDLEPPLGEAFERYRVEVLDGGEVVRTAEVEAPAFTYTEAMQAEDFPGGTPSPLAVRVAQGSAVVGWGAPAERGL